MQYDRLKKLSINGGDTRSRNLYRPTRNLYQKLLLMHVTKIVRFDWSAVFESFWYQKCALNRAAFFLREFLIQVSWSCVISIIPVSYTHLTLPTKRIV